MKKSECILVFFETVVDEKGSPHTQESYKKVPCDDRGVFNHRYYNEQERSMRESVNLVVPSYYVNEQLARVKYNGKEYDVKSILDDRKSCERYVILDCQEVKR